MNTLTKALATIQDSDSENPNGGFTAILSTPSLDRDGDILAREEWKEPLPEHITIDADHGMSVATTVGSARPYFNEKGQLLIDAVFSSIPRAQEVRTLVKEKHVRTVSVAFMTDKSKKSGEQRRELLNAGIVAIPANRDAVILDSKALDARALEVAEEKGVQVPEIEPKPTSEVFVKVTPVWDDKALESLLGGLKAQTQAGGATAGMGGDGSLTQAIHDASVHLGAQCTCFHELPDEDPTGTSSGANKSFTTFVDAKSVQGSIEDLQSRVQDALRAIAPLKSYPWTRATFLTDANNGTVVYQMDDYDLPVGPGSQSGTFARSFTDDGVTIKLSDEERPVSLVTTLVSAPDIKEANETIDTKTPQTLDEFKAALAALLNPPTETPAEPEPVAEVPAPAEEAAAAAEVTAEEPAADDVDPDKRARDMEMLLFANHF
jgi:hypothetical protein